MINDKIRNLLEEYELYSNKYFSLINANGIFNITFCVNNNNFCYVHIADNEMIYNIYKETIKMIEVKIESIILELENLNYDVSKLKKRDKFGGKNND